MLLNLALLHRHPVILLWLTQLVPCIYSLVTELWYYSSCAQNVQFFQTPGLLSLFRMTATERMFSRMSTNLSEI